MVAHWGWVGPVGMAWPGRSEDVAWAMGRESSRVAWLRRLFHEIHNEICQARKVTEIS